MFSFSVITTTPSRIPIILLLLSSYFTPTTCSANDSCFFPNGGLANSYTACSSTGASHSSCCIDGDVCTSAGYCVSNSKGYVYRGACTDSDWGNPCPDYCLANTNSQQADLGFPLVGKDGNSSAVKVIACNAADDDGTWCCAYDGNCCASETWAPVFGTVLAGETTSSTRASSTSSAAFSASHTAGAYPSPSSAAAVGIIVNRSPATCQTGTSPTSNPNNKTATIVGASVGVPLGLLALTCAILFIIERNKRKSMERDTTWDRLKTVSMTRRPARTSWARQQPLTPPRHAPTGAPVYVKQWESLD
ncbi:hypothetical protein LHYA1_G007344 [Lachnellula hyalina]|uniref:Mid2 domain-containing protein n=1 Tax=Lachnellula hyalina TaxID=1316788 RepID=A0A8H8TX23_9HELO|nr:uncharacterized protein LHYA1_G007344 [Lachnellula hyalina]TVY25062.1 hypothetical protein LHYA1_G007344 [Lachnellula hyalina]